MFMILCHMNTISKNNEMKKQKDGRIVAGENLIPFPRLLSFHKIMLLIMCQYKCLILMCPTVCNNTEVSEL